MVCCYRNKQGVAKNAEEIELLKRITKELENKSRDDEKKIGENYVNIENMQMNVSLQHRTITGLVEDRKYPSSSIHTVFLRLRQRAHRQEQGGH